MVERLNLYTFGPVVGIIITARFLPNIGKLLYLKAILIGIAIFVSSHSLSKVVRTKTEFDEGIKSNWEIVSKSSDILSFDGVKAYFIGIRREIIKSIVWLILLVFVLLFAHILIISQHANHTATTIFIAVTLVLFDNIFGKRKSEFLILVISFFIIFSLASVFFDCYFIDLLLALMTFVLPVSFIITAGYALVIAQIRFRLMARK